MYRNLLAAAALAATAIAATPASATDFLFDFSSQGTAGSTKVGTKTISYQASGWNLTKNASNSYSLNSANLIAWDRGLGVTSGANDTYSSAFADWAYGEKCSVAGNCSSHQIDNLGKNGGSSYDFVQLVFSEAVTLQSLTRYTYGSIGSSGGSSFSADTDMSIGSLANALTANGTYSSLSNLFKLDVNSTACNSMGRGSVCGDTWTATSTDKAVTNVASKVWLVSASVASNFGGDNKVDSFKVDQLRVGFTPAATPSVPEPATWGMMVLGFGFAGSALRRSRKPAALAA